MDVLMVLLWVLGLLVISPASNFADFILRNLRIEQKYVPLNDSSRQEYLQNTDRNKKIDHLQLIMTGYFSIIWYMCLWSSYKFLVDHENEFGYLVFVTFALSIFMVPYFILKKNRIS